MNFVVTGSTTPHANMRYTPPVGGWGLEVVVMDVMLYVPTLQNFIMFSKLTSEIHRESVI